MQRVASIDKCLDVVEAVQAAGENGLGIRALGRALGVNPTTIHNICQTLAARGYLIQDPISKRFRMGASWLPLAREGDLWHGLADAADDLVRQCREELDESIMLAVIDRSTVAALVYYPSSQALRVEEPRVMGPRAYVTAVGKLLLASLSEEALDRYRVSFPPEAFTNATITDPDEFRHELKVSRERGYARTRDESTPGVSAVAVPILDPRGETVAALGASAPSVRLDEAKSRHTRDVLRRFSKQIELTWFGGSSSPSPGSSLKDKALQM